ncbi:fimbrial protein [Pseudomonas sp. C32]|uniref:fimbrial protein n=1 Tax=Pseudomonas sp. C32 TaxID=1529208 RepID=UPI0026274492|nr:fimbrial protein [Pseudomonas sp. C32]MDN4548023.1 fimbrial protein [Pseudomonas sp. C32]
MKKTLLALTLGLASTSAFANTGPIHFEGKITASTCPITIVNPEDGMPGSLVRMGSVDASLFTGPGQEQTGSGFILRIPGGGACGVTPDSKANVIFQGGADDTGDFFTVTPPTAGGAENVVIVIRDKDNTAIAPNIVSPDYELNDTGVTDLRFDAYYRSTTASVTAGAASATVQFIVDII